MITPHIFGFVELAPLAIGFVDLVVFVIALAAFLVVGAGWVFFAVVAQVFQGISIFGSHPFGFIAGLLKAAMNSLAGVMMRNLDAAGNFFWGLAMSIWRVIYVVGATIAGLTTQLLGLSQSTSSGFTDVRGLISSGVGTAEHYATELYNDSVAHADDLYNRVEGDLANDVAALNGTIATDLQAALSHADVLYNRVEGDLANNAAALRDMITSDTNDAINHANDLYNRVEGDLTNSVRSLTQADATNLQAAENFATSLVGGLGIGSLRSTVTALQGQVSKIQTETDECLTPLCDTVTPQAPRLGRLGNLFQGLENLAVEAVILALAVEAVHDPAAVVADVTGTVNAVGGGVMSGLRDLVGV